MVSSKFITENVKRFNKNVQNFYCRKYAVAWLDEIYSYIRFGCSPDDYFRYEFYRKSDYERDQFITYQRSKQIIAKYNASDKIEILNNKVEFNKYFHDFIHRDWLEISKASSNELKEFLERHPLVIIKPIFGGQGRGIFICNRNDVLAQRIDLRHYSDCIVEEILVQHADMEALNSTSVNTVRVLTFQGKVIAAALRIGGAGAVVDNLHSNGVCGHIDVQTGVIDAPCIDMSFRKYIYHPATNHKLVGYEIPLWELVKQDVVKAATLIPEVGYVGWDVAILKDEVALIEGNHDPGHDVVQMIAQTGLYHNIIP